MKKIAVFTLLALAAANGKPMKEEAEAYLEKPVPYQEKPVPYQEKPVPYQEKPVPYEEKSPYNIPADFSQLSCGSRVLTAGTYNLISPNHPKNYTNDYSCSYTLTSGAGVGSLSLACSAFNVEYEDTCSWDALTVNGVKYCGSIAPSVHGQTSLNIQFTTDYSVVASGFSCMVTALASTGGGGSGGSGSCTCGVAGPISDRVVGGADATIGEWRWMAGLVSPGETRTWCGGSLINNRYVLTAAHCTEGSTASQIEVLLGDHRISVADGETRHKVAQIINHPSYTSVDNGFDVALLKLTADVTFNARRSPVCLPTDLTKTYAGVDAWATGFGMTSYPGSQATILKEVVLPVKTDSYCSTYWNVRPSTICAGGYSSGGKSVCRGDSGGPLVVKEANNRWTLIGAVSYGRPCAIANVPDVFARITAVATWVRENTKDATYCS